MSEELILLTITAASIGFVHTLIGPDHYLPFIVMSKAGNWSRFKTIMITLLSGVGHVLSSVVLGVIGIAMGLAIGFLEDIESSRGDLAAWALFVFGFAYFIWGIRRAIRNKPHKHIHVHDGQAHVHDHTHTLEHAHVHTEEGRSNLVPWILFTVFILGPCEPLIPILMYPAATESVSGLIIVTAVFGLTTIITMLGIVWLGLLGINRLPFGKMERYSHAMAGGAITLCGFAMLFLGL